MGNFSDFSFIFSNTSLGTEAAIANGFVLWYSIHTFNKGSVRIFHTIISVNGKNFNRSLPFLSLRNFYP